MQLSLPGMPEDSFAEELAALAAHADEAGYFDIETEGLDLECPITLISFLRKGRMQTFVQGENLDAFLNCIEDLPLLISFNGRAFDVPRILNHFHIPSLRCRHFDLLDLARHLKMRGGLKQIERTLGIARSPAVAGMSGEDAVWMWNDWIRRRDRTVLDRLILYCESDVWNLYSLARCLLDRVAQGPADAVPCARDAAQPRSTGGDVDIRADSMRRRLASYLRRQAGR